MDPQPLEMGDGVQPLNQTGQFVIAQGEGIAAAEDHFGNRTVPGQIADGRLPPAVGGIALRVRKIAAETVAAMDGADAGCDQQRPAVIFMQHAGGGPRLQLGQRIVAVPRRCKILIGNRGDLPQQGIEEIALLHPLHERHGYPEWKCLQRLRGGADAARRELQVLCQSSRIPDGVS